MIIEISEYNLSEKVYMPSVDDWFYLAIIFHSKQGMNVYFNTRKIFSKSYSTLTERATGNGNYLKIAGDLSMKLKNFVFEASYWDQNTIFNEFCK